MRVYLCGLATMPEPQRGQEFAAAARALVSKGHTSSSPYTSGFDIIDTDDAMALDEAAVAAAEAVVVLGGVPVECFETINAEYSGKPVIHLADLLRVPRAV